jgi:hypothetical protein
MLPHHRQKILTPWSTTSTPHSFNFFIPHEA